MARTPQNILVTGATAGLGRHMALHLAQAGHRVFGVGRNAERLRALQSEADAAGLRLEAFAMDVNDEASIAAARDHIEAATDGHGVDVLINNAGFGLLGPTEAISDADLRRQFDTNVFGLMAVTRAFLPAMRARRSGRVINISSMGGKVTLPFFGAYNATKYAVESLSDALRMELGPFGVDVVLVEPGMVKSEFADHALDELLRYRTPDSPYAPILANAERINDDAKRFVEVDTLWVSRAVARAVHARRPRPRYMVALHARFALMAARLLPTRVMDFIYTRSMGIGPKALTAPEPAAPGAAPAGV